MRKLSVGDRYQPGKMRWPEKGEYSFRDNQYKFLLSIAGLASAKINAVQEGEAEFALLVDRDVIFFLYRFGDEVDWADAPYSWWLTPDGQRTVPEPFDNKNLTLEVILLEATNGIVKAIRPLKLSVEFSRALQAAVSHQIITPLKSSEDFDEQLSSAYIKYPSPEAMVRRAVAHCRGENI